MKILKILCALLLLGACSNSNSALSFKYKKPVKEGIAAQVGDVTISHEEVNSGIESEIFELEQKIFDTRMNKIKSLLIEKYMNQDPKKKGLSEEEYINQVVAKGLEVKDIEVENFIVEKQIPKAQVNDDIKTRIKDYILNEKKRAALDQWLAKKNGGKDVEVYIEKPRRPSFDVKVGNSPTVGGENAKVTIVEFSDFQCPYCSRAAETVNQLKKHYGNKIKIAFRQFPLPFHKDAKGASNAALCADKQKKGNFWKLHDAFFQNQAKLKDSDILETAKKLGINTEQLKTCMDNKEFYAQIDEDMEHGKDIGVKSTPTFFVNGMLLQGAQPFEVFQEIIDAELAN